MYSPQRYILSHEQLARLRALVATVDIAPGPGGSRITPTSVCDGELDAIVPSRAAVYVVALYPSSQLVAHCDPPIAGARYHLPLQANDGCWSFSGGEWQQLAVGRVYRMDPTEVHGAVNWGTEVRLHLMVDTCPSTK